MGYGLIFCFVYLIVNRVSFFYTINEFLGQIQDFESKLLGSVKPVTTMLAPALSPCVVKGALNSEARLKKS